MTVIPAHYGDLLVLEPRSQFDECIIGIVERVNDTFVLYSKKCVIDAIIAEEPGAEDAELNAIDHYEFNIRGGWVGDHTPGFLLEEE